MLRKQKDSRHIQFRVGSDIELSQLQELFSMGAFWAQGRNLDDLAVAITNSDPVVSVWDGDLLIGFSRATSDGVYRATIWDVVIHPHYQGAGLGRKLVETVLSHPKMSRVERVYLMTSYKERFYEKIGFEYNQSTTMVLCNQPLTGEDGLMSGQATVINRVKSEVLR